MTQRKQQTDQAEAQAPTQDPGVEETQETAQGAFVEPGLITNDHLGHPVKSEK